MSVGTIGTAENRTLLRKLAIQYGARSDSPVGWAPAVGSPAYQAIKPLQGLSPGSTQWCAACEALARPEPASEPVVAAAAAPAPKKKRGASKKKAT